MITGITSVCHFDQVRDWKVFRNLNLMFYMRRAMCNFCKPNVHFGTLSYARLFSFMGFRSQGKEPKENNFWQRFRPRLHGSGQIFAQTKTWPNWTNFWTAKCASLGLVLSRSKTCRLSSSKIRALPSVPCKRKVEPFKFLSMQKFVRTRVNGALVLGTKVKTDSPMNGITRPLNTTISDTPEDYLG